MARARKGAVAYLGRCDRDSSEGEKRHTCLDVKKNPYGGSPLALGVRALRSDWLETGPCRFCCIV